MAEIDEPSLHETIQDVYGLVKRYHWWILTTTFLSALLAAAVSLSLPDRYTSEAMLGVVQQQISPRYVDPGNVMASADSVRAMEREILSRTRMLAIIDSFGLYEKERHKLAPEGVVDLMRKDVSIEPIEQVSVRGELSAFKVSFTAGDPRLAQDVAGRLASLFIEENLKTQGAQAATTTKFLTEALEAAKRRLDEQEQRLRDFKVSNLGDLPEQQQANLAALTDLRIQLQSSAAAANRAQQQRIYLEAVLNGHLARLQSEKANLLTRFTPRHPEIMKRDQDILRVQTLSALLQSESPDPERLQPSVLTDDPTLVQLKGQVEANVTEARQSASEERRLRAEIARYQGRLKLTPIREQQLTGIMRDYELFKQDYTDLLSKQLRSRLATNLQEQQGGQNFRLVDPPTFPVKPSSPKRLKISLLAVGVGIALGLALALLMNISDRSFHSEKALRHSLPGVPLVMAIPVLMTAAEQRKRNWVFALECLAGFAMVVAVCAAELYVYRHG
jgi:succinoglycan biosynthesis transport protein ExoP